MHHVKIDSEQVNQVLPLFFSTQLQELPSFCFPKRQLLRDIFQLC